MPRRIFVSVLLCCFLLASGGLVSSALGAVVLTPVGSFANPFASADSTGGLAVDANTVYVSTINGGMVLDRLSYAGTSLAPLNLSGGSTYLDGFFGLANTSSTNLYAVAMKDGTRTGDLYSYNKTTGALVSQVDFSPAVDNPTGVAFDGTNIYVTQNDLPYDTYRVDTSTGVVLANLGQAETGDGQSLSLAYWSNANVLLEGYSTGLAVVDPSTGSALQFITTAALGMQSFDQVFGAAVYGNDLFLTTTSTIYHYTLSVPEPATLALATVALSGSLARRRRAWSGQN